MPHVRHVSVVCEVLCPMEGGSFLHWIPTLIFPTLRDCPPILTAALGGICQDQLLLPKQGKGAERKKEGKGRDRLTPMGPSGGLALCVLSRVLLFVTAWTAAYQASLSMGFSRQKYWNLLPFPSQGIFLTQGLNPTCITSQKKEVTCPVSQACEGQQGQPDS